MAKKDKELKIEKPKVEKVDNPIPTPNVISKPSVIKPQK